MRDIRALMAAALAAGLFPASLTIPHHNAKLAGRRKGVPPAKAMKRSKIKAARKQRQRNG